MFHVEPMHIDDTIVAVSTPPGVGGIAVIRLSGKSVQHMAESVLHSSTGSVKLDDRKAAHGWLVDGTRRIDEVIAIFFQGPHSYTGENVVEMSCHGSPFIAGQIVDLLVRSGARPAQPGEFTFRAFINGRLDLVQAEAVADLIHSKTEASRKSALTQLQGTLSQRLDAIRNRLIHACSMLEVQLDFSDEDIAMSSSTEILSIFDRILVEMNGLLESYGRGRIFHEGLKIVLVGKPNVGKSSILNRLLEKERAIVTEIPGTTRDTIEDVLDIRGVLTRITDTAGIRETTDPIELRSVRKSEQAFSEADLILLVLDGSAPLDSDDERLIARIAHSEKRFFILINKSDLAAAWQNAVLPTCCDAIRHFRISALEGSGVSYLIRSLEEEIQSGFTLSDEEALLTNIRQKDCIASARDGILMARASLEREMSHEFVLLDLRGALERIGEITGQNSGEEILSAIFSNFCIGK
jgi:tRNA modification GTPase